MQRPSPARLRLPRVAALLPALLLLGPAAAPAEERSGGERARELVDLSGLDHMLESVESHVHSGLARKQKGLDASERAVAKRVAGEHFDGDRLRRAAVARLEERMVPRHAETALQWLRSDLGRRITRLEEAASTPEALSAMRAWAQRLQKGEVSRERVALARRLDAASGSTELAVEVALGSALGVATGANAARPAEEREDPRAIERAFEAQRERLRPRMKSMTLQSMLYAYRDLSRSELERYADFLESEAGAWYSEAIGDAIESVLGRAALGFGEALGSALAEADSEQPL